MVAAVKTFRKTEKRLNLLKQKNVDWIDKIKEDTEDNYQAAINDLDNIRNSISNITNKAREKENVLSLGKVTKTKIKNGKNKK